MKNLDKFYIEYKSLFYENYTNYELFTEVGQLTNKYNLSKEEVGEILSNYDISFDYGNFLQSTYDDFDNDYSTIRGDINKETFKRLLKSQMHSELIIVNQGTEEHPDYIIKGTEHVINNMIRLLYNE